MKLQNGYQIIYSIRDKNGVEHFYAGKGTKPSKKDDVMVMVASGKVVYGGEKDREVVVADGITTKELLNITANGEYNIANYQKVIVEVPGEEPAGSVEITSNGEHNVAGKATANVNVPIPAGYIQPEGSLNITANANNIDVTNKAAVNVNVPIPADYIKPSGQLSITKNFSYDVTNYAAVYVNVPLPSVIDLTGYGNNYNYCSDNDKIIYSYDTNISIEEGGWTLYLPHMHGNDLSENYSKSDFDTLFTSININTSYYDNTLEIVLPVCLTITGQELYDLQEAGYITLVIADIPWLEDPEKEDALKEYLYSAYSGGLYIKDIFGKEICHYNWDSHLNLILWSYDS